MTTLIAQGPVDVDVGRRVLDPCCGSRMMWFDRQHPDAVFGDNRHDQHVLCDGRTLRIEPDVLLDFTDLPYPDGTFSLVVFDPPHLHTAGPKSWMAAKYGKLSENWQDDLRKGFSECFRVLASNGILIFKWNETQVKVREVLALTPVQPLFGHPTGRKGLTHWMVFMSPKASLSGRPEPVSTGETASGRAVERASGTRGTGRAMRTGPAALVAGSNVELRGAEQASLAERPSRTKG